MAPSALHTVCLCTHPRTPAPACPCPTSGTPQEVCHTHPSASTCRPQAVSTSATTPWVAHPVQLGGMAFSVYSQPCRGAGPTTGGVQCPPSRGVSCLANTPDAAKIHLGGYACLPPLRPAMWHCHGQHACTHPLYHAHILDHARAHPATFMLWTRPAACSPLTHIHCQPGRWQRWRQRGVLLGPTCPWAQADQTALAAASPQGLINLPSSQGPPQGNSQVHSHTDQAQVPSQRAPMT